MSQGFGSVFGRYGLLFYVLVSVLLLGCLSSSSPETIVKDFPQVKQFLASHPNAVLSFGSYPKASFEADANYWTENCDQNIASRDFYSGTFKDADLVLVVLVDQNLQLVCAFEKQTGFSNPSDLNASDSNSDADQNTGVSDQNGSPVPDANQVVPDLNQTPPNPCENPWNCSLWTLCDGNKQTRTCSLKSGCVIDQNKPSESLPCTFQAGLKNCSDQNGVICASNQACTGGYINANNTGLCCTACSFKFCADLNGSVCDVNKVCSVSVVSSKDTNSCCTGTCAAIDPCAGVTCADSNKTCVAGTCVLKTCAQMNGSVCGTGLSCSTTVVDANGSNACCTGTCQAPPAPTCSAQGGQICSVGSACIVDFLPQTGIHYTPDENGWSTASDSAYCCDINRTEVYGCASGDLSIAGPATWGLGFDDNELRVSGFVVDYGFSDSNKLGATMIPVELYIDGVLAAEYTQVYAHENGVLTSFANAINSGTHILYYQTDSNLLGKTVRVVIDPNDLFVETSSSNNEYQGTIQ